MSENIIWKIYLVLMCIYLPIYLSIIKFKKNNMNIEGSIFYYLISIVICYILYKQIANASELLLYTTILYIFYLLYLLTLVYKYKGIRKFNNDDRNITIILFISIMMIEYLSKGTFNKSLLKVILNIIYK